MQQLQCKVALVTGGAGCLGSRLCRELISNGCKAVVLVDNEKARGNAVQKQLTECFGPGRADFFQGDVRKNEDFLKAFRFVQEKHKQLDIVINAAGIMDECNYTKMIDTNVIGSIQGIKYGLTYVPKLKAGPEGTIVTLTSVLALMPLPTLPVYSGSSNYLVGTTRSIGCEETYKKYETNVAAICLGATMTPMYHKNKHLFEDYSSCFPCQQPEDAVREILNVIAKPINGAIYEIEEGKTNLLEFKDRKELRKK